MPEYLQCIRREMEDMLDTRRWEVSVHHQTNNESDYHPYWYYYAKINVRHSIWNMILRSLGTSTNYNSHTNKRNMYCLGSVAESCQHLSPGLSLSHVQVLLIPITGSLTSQQIPFVSHMKRHHWRHSNSRDTCFSFERSTVPLPTTQVHPWNISKQCISPQFHISSKNNSIRMHDRYWQEPAFVLTCATRRQRLGR